MKGTLVWSNELLSYDFGEGHPMRSVRCKLGAEELMKIPSIEVVSPRKATDEEILLFHTPEYLNLVKHGAPASMDTPTEGLYEPALWSVGATLTAVDKAMEHGGVAVNICGGWHHAERERGKGFCIFNDIGIGIEYARKQYGIDRVMVIDWDVHHGDGTWKGFKDDKDVFTISVHQHPSTQYPYTSGFEDENDERNINIPVKPGESEEEVIKKLVPLFPRIIPPFMPQLLIIQMGVDGHKDDPMSGINLTERFYHAVAPVLARCSRKRKFPVVLLGGGGFNFPKTAQLWRGIVEDFINIE